MGMGPSMADTGRGRCVVRPVARRRVGRMGCMSTRRGPRRDVTGRSKTVEAPGAKPGSASSGAPANPPAASRPVPIAGVAAPIAAALPPRTGTLAHAIGGSVSPAARRGPGDQAMDRATVPPAAGHPPGRHPARGAPCSIAVRPFIDVSPMRRRQPGAGTVPSGVHSIGRPRRPHSRDVGATSVARRPNPQPCEPGARGLLSELVRDVRTGSGSRFASYCARRARGVGRAGARGAGVGRARRLVSNGRSGRLTGEHGRSYDSLGRRS